MAKVNIKGNQVAFYLDKLVGGVPTKVRVLCADNLSLTINTEEVEVTADCEDTEDENAVVFKNYEPGAVDWSGSIGGNIRRIDGPDAATNLTAEEFMDMQLAGKVLDMTYSLGTAVGAASYAGKIFFTQNTLNGGSGTPSANFSANFRGKGPLPKSLITA